MNPILRRALPLFATVSLMMPAQAALNLGTVPLYLGASVQPIVMLTLSKDQELYKKAYSDYSDLDGDGLFETTYKHSINYYGYFDPFKCYSYVSANRRFEPQADTSALAPASQKYCDTVAGEWSGNFLNWATMTRMDAVRKVLYGGLRSPSRTADGGFVVGDGDTQTSTTLERAYLPNDAHSFAKYYDGADITRLTGATPLTVATTSATSIAIGTGAKTFTVVSNTNIAVGDIMEFALTGAPTTFMRGNVTAVAGASITVNVVFTGGAGTFAAWTATNLSKKGLTICNTTLGGTSPNHLSQTNANMPRMRVAKGNFVLWAGNERWQCIWGTETVAGVNGGAAVSAVNGNTYATSRIPASASSPTLATHGAGAGFGDFFVRVQACVASLIGTEKCKQYAAPAPTGTLKPIGLVQVYGEPGLIRFGLITGSYERNVAGGVLRKNAGVVTDEIGPDGVFLAPPGAGHIIGTLSRMRPFGYAYVDGLYNAADSCGFGLTSITAGPGSAVQCTNWGNPMSEIYYEALRYLAGGQPKSGGNPVPTAAYNFTYAGSRDAALGLPVATWADPLSQTNYCAPLNTVVFNSSVSSYDNDQIPTGSAKSYLGTTLLTTGINSTDDAETLTNNLGDSESITGSHFIGRILGGAAAETNELCDAKTLGGAGKKLGRVSGLCPEGPTVGGSFLIGGLAHKAHTNRIRTDLTVAVVNQATALKVNTYAVQLSSATPRLEILVPGGTPGQKVVLQPACRMINAGVSGGCALVDMRIVSQERGADFDRGVIYVNWEDSEQGGDFDQDMWGVMSYCMQSTTTTQCPGAGTNTITVTTDVAAESTIFPMGLGYIISGTNKDGPHFHSGIENFNYTDSTPPVPLTSLTRAGAVATATRNNHGFGVGDRVTIAGATGASATFNGTFTITGTTANTFTYSLGAATPTSPAAGAPTVTVGGCVNCQPADVATRHTYSIGATSAQALKDPLWYATKYGGFKDTNSNNQPDQAIEWDSKREDGSDGTDGIPDNYFLVTNPGALETAMDRTFIYILQVSSASSVATNSTSLQTGSRVYQARFNSNDWSGQLLSFTIDIAGVIDPTPNFDAGQKLPNFNSRIIVTYNPGATPGTAATPAGIPFRFASLTPAQQTELRKDGASQVVDSTAGGACTSDNVPIGCTDRGSLRLEWLRGNPVAEGTTATAFRVRPSTKLADIVNSTPRFVGPPSASFTDAAYLTFRSTYAGRTPMLYVGSNGGMFHAFEATTGAGGGVERFAYVPNKVYQNLTRLTTKPYSHRYFVDGTPSVNDACFGACAAASDWKTVAVGGYNSGGQGYYALDVTDPTTWSTEGLAAASVLWEFTDVNDPDLGYSYSKPLIVKMSNGRWAAVFGNGYNNSIAEAGELACDIGTGTAADPYARSDAQPGCSTSLSGHAYLFVLFLDGGTDGAWTQGVDYIKISTNTGTDTATPSNLTPGTPNGIATPVAVDSNGDGMVDFIYAGDLVGNLWKFDVTSASEAAWAVASAGAPLFIAQDASGNRQPITSAPVLNPHPGGGFLVLFGTGKYMEITDDTGPFGMSAFYGIWDKLDNTTVVRSDLMQQKVLNVSAGNLDGGLVVGTNKVRLTSAYVPNYSATDRTNAAGTFGDADVNPDYVAPTAVTPANQRGWLLEMPNSGNGGPPNSPATGTGEKIVFDPLISTGKIVFTTLLPSTQPCDAGGTSYIMDMDPVSGSRLAFSPFDLNADNNFTSGDFVTFAGKTIAVSGLGSTIGIVPQPTVIQGAPGKEVKVLSGSSGGLMAVLENAPTSGPTGVRTGRRITWREMLSN